MRIENSFREFSRKLFFCYFFVPPFLSNALIGRMMAQNTIIPMQMSNSRDFLLASMMRASRLMSQAQRLLTKFASSSG